MSQIVENRIVSCNLKRILAQVPADTIYTLLKTAVEQVEPVPQHH